VGRAAGGYEGIEPVPLLVSPTKKIEKYLKSNFNNNI
jgi:hypothetical protein